MKKLMLKLFLLLFIAYHTAAAFPVYASNTNTISAFVDGINCTRWTDFTVVYMNKDNTGQNQWGHNIIVEESGKVTAVIPAGDIAGINLAIPKDGMIVSVNGKNALWFSENVSLGDYVKFDKLSSRILISKTSSFSYLFTKQHRVDGINAVRYANTMIIYRGKPSTETNFYGYEVTVGKDGIVKKQGGNNSVIPEGGYVVSGVGNGPIEFLRMYGIPGAKCIISNDQANVSFVYDEQGVKRTSQYIITELTENIEKAKKEFKYLDYPLIESKLSVLEKDALKYDLTNPERRNMIATEVESITMLLSESPAVELRSIWYQPNEKTSNEVTKTVKDFYDCGFNQVCLMVTNGYNTFIPLPTEFPFKQASKFNGFDVLGEYIKQCHSKGIEVVICVPVFFNDNAKNANSQWLTKANKESGSSEANYFFSPANDDYIDYFLKYIGYIIENYDIDGLQLDYIRYPYCDGVIDYGYDEVTIHKFCSKYGLEPSVVESIGSKIASHEYWGKWVEFKTELVSSAVKKVSTLTREKRPDIILSADVAAETVNHYYMQDSSSWVKEGYIDALYPMTYGRAYMEHMIEKFNGFTGNNSFLYMGVGVYLGLSDSDILTQIEQARDGGADGACFFEMNSFLLQNLGDYLSKNAYAKPALSPTYNSKSALLGQLNYSANRIKEVIIPLGGLSAEDAEEILSLTNEVIKKIQNNGIISSEISHLVSLAADISKNGNDVVLKDYKKALKIAALSKEKSEPHIPEPDDSKDESDTESDAGTETSIEPNTSEPHDSEDENSILSDVETDSSIVNSGETELSPGEGIDSSNTTRNILILCSAIALLATVIFLFIRRRR